MAIVFDRVKAGDVLYDVHREKMGNTTLSRVGCWPVRVLEVNQAEGWAVVSWNGNAAKKWWRSRVERLRRSPPKTSKKGGGSE